MAVGCNALRHRLGEALPKALVGKDFFVPAIDDDAGFDQLRAALSASIPRHSWDCALSRETCGRARGKKDKKKPVENHRPEFREETSKKGTE